MVGYLLLGSHLPAQQGNRIKYTNPWPLWQGKGQKCSNPQPLKESKGLK